jgi:soluble lytic murein transglycosylase
MAWLRRAWDEAATQWARVATIKGGQEYGEPAAYWAGRAQEQRGDAEAAARHWNQLVSEAPRTYYGMLAARRLGRAEAARALAVPVVLPTDPREPLRADARFGRVEALRAVGLQEWADEEMEDMTRRAGGDARRLYALSTAYAQDARYHLALRILGRHFGALARGSVGPLPQHFWETLYPLGWRAELEAVSARAALDPFLVAALVREESSFFPRARSRVGARGLMQLMPETARPMAERRGLAFADGELLDDPVANLEMGTSFFARLLREFGDPRVAAAGYNAGPARVREWLRERPPGDLEVWVEQIPFAETRGFVKRVMRSWAEYRRIYGGPGGVGP